MSGIFRRASAAAAVVLLATGCADLRWHKDGADAVALERDLDECARSARAQASSRAWATGSGAAPMVGVDAQGRAFITSPGRDDSDRFFAERDLERFCMSNKGYKLVPAKER